jgi:hypothetical protein
LRKQRWNVVWMWGSFICFQILTADIAHRPNEL